MNEAKRRASDYAPRPKLEPWQTALMWGVVSYFVIVFFYMFTFMASLILGTPSLGDLFPKYFIEDVAGAAAFAVGIIGFGYNKWQMKNHEEACDREREELEKQHAHDQQ